MKSPKFVVVGYVTISDCVWDLSDSSNNNIFHFSVNGGFLLCNKMVVNSFDNSNLTFYNSSSLCSLSYNDLVYKDIKIDKNNKHFHISNGESIFTKSVCNFITLFIFIVFLDIREY
jgi:hypothetical protein